MRPGTPGRPVLVGGDKVLFKAGVVYQGQIIFRASGTDGNPIVYEGTGWGTGHATLSGQTTVQVNFTPLADNSNLSVATLPSGWTPNRYSVVDIDGRQSFMSNTSASTNPYFISDASSATPNAVTYQASEMTGSGTCVDPHGRDAGGATEVARAVDDSRDGAAGLRVREPELRPGHHRLRSHNRGSELVGGLQPRWAQGIIPF